MTYEVHFSDGAHARYDVAVINEQSGVLTVRVSDGPAIRFSPSRWAEVHEIAPDWMGLA